MANDTYPFGDMSEMMKQFKVPGLDMAPIIESRRKDGISITTDPILKESQLQKMKTTGLSSPVLEALNYLKSRGQSLGLPENLYVVGTVNMDETTQPFSRKVLDRANTIEFTASRTNGSSFHTR